MKSLVQFLIARLREPSTYAGLGAVLVAFHVHDAMSWANDLTTLGIGAAGVLAMFCKETGALDN
jgi:hypothetical protein